MVVSYCEVCGDEIHSINQVGKCMSCCFGKKEKYEFLYELVVVNNCGWERVVSTDSSYDYINMVANNIIDKDGVEEVVIRKVTKTINVVKRIK